MKTSIRALALAGACLAAGCATAGTTATIGAGGAATAGLSAERLERLEQATHGYVDEGRVAGVVTMITRHGRIAHLDAYGMADIENNRPMTEDSYFYLYSMTKPVTSVALLMLYEEGRFQLTDPIGNYLPELADARVFDRESGRVVDAVRQPTIQDVFRHTAGYLYGPQGDTDFDRAYGEANFTETDLAGLTQKLGRLPLAYQPGTQWVYSVSHDVQARLVEVLSGMSFDEFCRTRIFEPLGMEETVFGRPEALEDRFAVIYGPGENGRLTPTGALDAPGAASQVFGGFSLSSAVGDYAIFAEMLLNGGERNGVRILSPTTVSLMATDQLPEGVYRGAAGGGRAYGEGYGLGVRVVTDRAEAGNLTSEGTFGWSGAAGTHVVIDPEQDMVALFMIQSSTGGARMSDEFETLVYQAIVE